MVRRLVPVSGESDDYVFEVFAEAPLLLRAGHQEEP